MIRRLLALAAVGAALGAALGAAPAPAQLPSGDVPYLPARSIIADVQKLVTPAAVSDTFTVTLGGARQVVNVRGTDRANPILLFLHGGPGAVEMPVAWSFQRPWEDYFTVVQWDQRGAGKSYALNDPATIAPTLTLERYRDDAIELIELLTKRYGQRKIVLVGHSWGSALGLAVAAARPDLLHAYVGIGQAIDWRENEAVGFRWTLAEARRRGDAEAVATLTAMQPYPRPGPLRIEDADAWRKYSIRYGGLAAYRDNADFYFDATRLSPLYMDADRKAWGQGSAFTVTHLWPRLSDVSFKTLTRLRVPVVLFLGRHDRTVQAPLAAAWFARLQAPAKTIVWFEHSAHLPMVEEPGRTLTALVDQVRPLATGRR